MAEIVIRIPEELKRKIESMGVDVSPVVREVLEEKIRDIERFERIVSRSQLTEEEAEDLAKKISERISARMREHVSGRRR